MKPASEAGHPPGRSFHPNARHRIDLVPLGVILLGQPPHAAAVSVAFARLAKELGLQGISDHTLRHTGATVMLAKGVSLRAVQTSGGWSSLRMVERYAHVDDAELARAVRITHSHTDEATKAVTATEDEAAKKESAGGSK